MAEKPGRRYPLLLYLRTADRIWKHTLFLGVILLVVWYLPLLKERSFGWVSSKELLLAAAIAVLVIGLFMFLSRSMAYVQVKSDHLSLVTPFLRLKVSYRRIRSTHPVMLQQLFPPHNAKWAQRRYLEPFYGKTVIVIDLKGFPLDPKILRLFLPTPMFSPRTDGLVLLVEDWMKFSTEFDSAIGVWLQSQKRKEKNPGSYSMR